MKTVLSRGNRAWRKSRIAARLLLIRDVRPLRPGEKVLAEKLSADPEVTNRLIEQGLYNLGMGKRKDAFDKKLVERRG